MSNENVTELHHRIGCTLSLKHSQMVQKEASESGDSIEDVIAKAIAFYCEMEDDARNFDFIKVRKRPQAKAPPPRRPDSEISWPTNDDLPF